MSNQIYYIPNSNSTRYTESLDAAGVRTGLINNVTELKDKIEQTANFCRTETSISTRDLLTYIRNDIVLYAFDLDNDRLSGVLTFNVNKPKINLSGICVPELSVAGTGSQLMRTIIRVAENMEGVNAIYLDCYSERVANFYKKNGFVIHDQHMLTQDSDNDSEEDSDSDSEEDIKSNTKYTMIYHVVRGGRKTTRRNQINKRKTIKKHRKTKHRKTKHRKTKHRKTKHRK